MISDYYFKRNDAILEKKKIIKLLLKHENKLFVAFSHGRNFCKIFVLDI